MIEGGDQIAAIITLLLLPLALTDERRWHWSRPGPVPGEASGRRALATLVALSALLMIRIQVAVIYFDSVVGKLAAPEWRDGTALYYWLTHPTFGAPHWLRQLLLPLLVHPSVALLTWAVIAVEIALFMGLTTDRRYRGPILLAGIALHTGIILAHGLVSFGVEMFAALVLFLRPVDQLFAFRALTRKVESPRFCEAEKLVPLRAARD